MFLKRILAIVSAGAMAVSLLTGAITVSAGDTIITGGCGKNAIWSLDTETGILTISGTGEMYTDKSVYEWGYYRYRNEIKEVIFEDGITSISNGAFGPFDLYLSQYDEPLVYPNLNKLTLPLSVKNIGNFAFYKTGLTSIEFSEGLETIGDAAFAYTLLSGNLNLPQTLNTLGDRAFCATNITSVKLNEGIMLGGCSFRNCHFLKEVTIPAGIIYLTANTSNAGRPNCGFANCTGIERVIIKGGGIVDFQQSDPVQNGLGEGLFSDCTSLKEIIIDCENIEYVDPVVWLTDEQQESGTFWIENHPTFYIYKDSTTEETLKRTGYFRNANIQYIADFSALETAIEKAEGIETSAYTDESVSAFNEVLKNGKMILEDLTSTQDEVDSAVKAINSAIKALEVKKDEPTSSEPTGNSSEPTKPSSSSSTAKPTTAVPKVTTPVVTTVAKPAKVKSVKLKAKKKKLNVSWKKVSGATGYEVLYATNNKFTKGKKTVTVKKNKVTLKKLKPKKKYFVKVRAYKLANGRKYFGKWSKVVKKKTK